MRVNKRSKSEEPNLNDNKMQLLDLPYELIFIIFANMNVNRLFRLAWVSKFIRRMALDPKLWEVVLNLPTNIWNLTDNPLLWYQHMLTLSPTEKPAYRKSQIIDAVLQRQYAHVKKLFKIYKKGRINFQNKLGLRPIDIATIHSDSTMIELLLADSLRMTTIGMAPRCEWNNFAARGIKSPLILAVRRGDVEIVEKLLPAFVNEAKKCPYGAKHSYIYFYKAVQEAIAATNMEMVQKLLVNVPQTIFKYDVNIFQQTAIDVYLQVKDKAVIGNALEIILFLCKQDSSTLALTLLYVLQQGHWRIFNAIIHAFDAQTIFAIPNLKETIKRQLGQGCPYALLLVVNAWGIGFMGEKFLKATMNLSAMCGMLQLLHSFLKAGANIEYLHNTIGAIAIYHCYKYQDEYSCEILEFFRKAGITEHMQDAEANNVLHLLAGVGHHDALTWFLQRGVDPMQVNKQGMTPLMCIQSSGNIGKEKCIEELTKFMPNSVRCAR